MNSWSVTGGFLTNSLVHMYPVINYLKEYAWHVVQISQIGVAVCLVSNAIILKFVVEYIPLAVNSNSERVVG